MEFEQEKTGSGQEKGAKKPAAIAAAFAAVIVVIGGLVYLHLTGGQTSGGD